MAVILRIGRPLTRGISPAEIDGLASVLRLMQTVCAHCDAARIAMAESTAWQPLLVIVGLLGCPVPPVLKVKKRETSVKKKVLTNSLCHSKSGRADEDLGFPVPLP